MKARLACISIATLVFASCDKSETSASSSNTPPKQAQTDPNTGHPAIADKDTQDKSGSPAGNAVNPPATGPSELTVPDQTIAKYKSDGIPSIPRHVSDKILANAAHTESNDDQLNIINQQASAWRHLNAFREGDGPIPDHMKTMLLQRLSTKHGDSWSDMAPELDEQIAASAKVDELRAKGIPGLSADESQNLIIKAIEKYGPDYKAILSTAEQAAKK